MKHFLKIAAIAPIILLVACSKKTPTLGLNSNLKISQIKVTDLSDPSGGSAAILAVGNFTFVKANPTSSSDTTRLVDSFYLPTTNGYDQNLNFNTPNGTKNLYFDLSFYLNVGTASAITVDNIQVDYNDKNVLNSGPLNGSTLGNKIFKMPTQTATY